MAFAPISFIEKNLIDDAEFMNLYHRVYKDIGLDDATEIKNWIWPALRRLANSPINFTDEYKVAYIKYRLFILVCAQLVLDKLGSNPTSSKPTDIIIKDLDSNLWSTFDKQFSIVGYDGTYFGFRNYSNKVTTVMLSFDALAPDDPEFLYKLSLLEQKVHLYRYDINHRRKDLGLIKIKDITRSNIKAWAEGN